jgi:hypothetical protein
VVEACGVGWSSRVNILRGSTELRRKDSIITLNFLLTSNVKKEEDVMKTRELV